MDFDYRTMSRVLKVPDEKFRDKIFRTLEENVTTMKRELGTVPPRREIISALIDRFSKVLGRLTPAKLDPETLQRMEELERWFTSDRFFFRKTSRIPRGVKIREGVEILYGLHKARGGLIRTVEAVEEERLTGVDISGDFQFYPKEDLSRLERNLREVAFRREAIHRRIERFYEEKRVETPGVCPDDLTQTIVTARSS